MSYKETIFLLIFLFGCSTFPSVNSTVTCISYSTSISCTVETTNTTLIQETIASKIVSSHTYLGIFINGDGAGATLNISLPENIIGLEVYNNVDTTIFIETSTVNSGVEDISFPSQNTVSIMQKDFFIYFPNLEYFYSFKLGMKFLPFFSENKNIEYIVVYNSVLEDVSNRAIDYRMVGNLTKLVYFFWNNSEINEIEPGAFKESNNLEYLILRNNKIHELKSCTLEGLENIVEIDLSNNNISSVHPYAFIDLSKVTKLDLSSNANMQLTPIIRMKEISELDLSDNNRENISPEMLEQLPKLSKLKMNDINFNCTCETQWISKLSDFGISLYLTGSTCIGEASRQASDSTLYINCKYRSFQCFNKSIECVGENWTRVDTLDDCECNYPEESYTVSEICNDVDECEDSSICQGNCTNTIGSYKCDCLEGFYNVNDTLCSDIDECIVDNENCNQLCTNNEGSYECSCLSGYQRMGFFGCSDINECDQNNGGCSQLCTNNEGSYECSCLPGYQMLGISGCVDINECSLNNGNCSQNCSNTVGSYECSCLPGYQMLGLSGCIDINECSLNNGNCSQSCSNTVGSYECSCLPGFLKHGFTECSLTDECNNNNGGCHQNCTNSIDGYVCSCFEGFNVSSLNSSHCDKDPNAGTGEQNANSKGPEFYVLFFLCFIFLVTITLLFVLLIVVFLYFRREIQLLKSTPASKVLSLPELDNNKLKESLRMSPIQESDNIKMNYGAKETEEKDLPLSDYPQV